MPSLALTGRRGALLPRSTPGARLTGRVARLLAPLGLGAGVGLAIAWEASARRPALIAALAVLAPLPLVVRALQGRFDPFEPVQLLAISILVLFVVRPIAELHYGVTTYGPYLTRAGFDGALSIALVGTAGLYAGYFLVPGARIAARLPRPPDRWHTRRSLRFAIGLMVLALVMLLLFQLTSGLESVLQLYSGRNMAFDSRLRQQSTAWIYLGPYLTIPASILLVVVWRRLRSTGVGLLLLAAVAAGLVLTVPRGDRTLIITLVLPLVTLPYLVRERRPRLRSIVVALLVAVLAINVLRLERNRDERTDPVGAAVTALTTPGKQAKDFITGPDPSLFSVLALEYQIVPGDVHYSPGITPISILAGPVPGRLWPGKPQPGAVHVTKYLFYHQSKVARASFLPSTFGDMYADFGFAAVAVYSLLVGVALRLLYEWFRANERHPAAQIVFAACLPLVIIFMRNDITDTLAHSVALVLPIVVCAWACTRPRARARSRA